MFTSHVSTHTIYNYVVPEEKIPDLSLTTHYPHHGMNWYVGDGAIVTGGGQQWGQTLSFVFITSDISVMNKPISNLISEQIILIPCTYRDLSRLTCRVALDAFIWLQILTTAWTDSIEVQTVKKHITGWIYWIAMPYVGPSELKCFD